LQEVEHQEVMLVEQVVLGVCLLQNVILYQLLQFQLQLVLVDLVEHTHQGQELQMDQIQYLDQQHL
tara:strand:+ start:40 stop:237 length:198 start_codon:yes stop_codon:yes gene_type:complete